MPMIANPPAVCNARRAALVSAGWRPGIPVGLSTIAVLADMQVCGSMICPDCQTDHLEYHPLHRGTAYVAFAVCPCGFSEEV